MHPDPKKTPLVPLHSAYICTIHTIQPDYWVSPLCTKLCKSQFFSPCVFTHALTDDFLHNMLLVFLWRDNLWIFYIQSIAYYTVFSGSQSQMHGYTIYNLMTLVSNFKAWNVFQNNQSGTQLLLNEYAWGLWRGYCMGVWRIVRLPAAGKVLCSSLCWDPVTSLRISVLYWTSNLVRSSNSGRALV